MIQSKNILVSPLDWGLGHATRCIPIVSEFLKLHCKVFVATSGKQHKILFEEFPTVTFLDLSGYEIEYPEKGLMTTKILLQLPKIKRAIDFEHQWLDKVVDEYAIDMVVSDNRYGLWSKKVKSILITHQIFIKSVVGESVLKKIADHYFNNFDEIWIPDVQGEKNLSGDLSHKKPLPQKFKFIGILSRFSSISTMEKNTTTQYDFMVIISGPEPQRTIFENIVLKQIENTNLKGIVVRGLPDNTEKLKIESPELLIFNHLDTTDFFNYIQNSEVVISRSGYSTIMDLASLGKKAIFVPTPGQTEQEYLAQYHSKKNHYYFQYQNDFNLKKALDEVVNYDGIKSFANTFTYFQKLL